MIERAILRALLIYVAISPAIAEPLLSNASLEIAAALRDRALATDVAWQVLESLTTEVGSRVGGSDGDTRAVAWARSKFLQLGFDRVVTEPVTFPRWVRGAESASVVSPYPHALAITALGGSIATPGEGIKAELAYFASVEALETAADDSLAGRIVFIGKRMERARDGSGYGPVVAGRARGPAVAARKGALAILIRSVGTDDDRLPHTGMTEYSAGVRQVPAAALSNPDADLLQRLLQRGAVTVQLHLGSSYQGEYTSYNVIGDIVGSERPREYVLIGGHLDSWDLGTGAIDDGAGCAITMAAASLIAALPTRPSRTVRVVLYANEEQGLWGARAYREAHAGELNRHIIGAESDFGAGRIYKFSTRVQSSALALIDQINQVLAPLGITRGGNNASGGPDLIPMRQAGMALASLQQDGSDYFDYHHTANDTLDKVDPAALAQNVAAYAAFAYLAAEAPGHFGFGLGTEETTE